MRSRRLRGGVEVDCWDLDQATEEHEVTAGQEDGLKPLQKASCSCAATQMQTIAAATTLMVSKEIAEEEGADLAGLLPMLSPPSSSSGVTFRK